MTTDRDVAEALLRALKALQDGSAQWIGDAISHAEAVIRARYTWTPDESARLREGGFAAAEDDGA